MDAGGEGSRLYVYEVKYVKAVDLAEQLGNVYGNSSTTKTTAPSLMPGLEPVEVRTTEMPPADAKSQPTTEQRSAVIRWIQAARDQEANRNAGDPGPVLARRLSNEEYNYSIRDLTGADIRPTATFPVDPANEAGFDNTGESLAMSPALLKKYLDAARDVVDHMLLTPSGIAFAPIPS